MSEYRGSRKYRSKIGFRARGFKEPYRMRNPYKSKLGISRGGGGGGYRPSRNPYVIRHDFHYEPEPKDKPPKLEYSWPRKAEPWTEPQQYKLRNTSVKNELNQDDVETLFEKLAEKRDEVLLEKLFERMEADFEKQYEATKKDAEIQEKVEAMFRGVLEPGKKFHAIDADHTIIVDREPLETNNTEPQESVEPKQETHYEAGVDIGNEKLAEFIDRIDPETLEELMQKEFEESNEKIEYNEQYDNMPQLDMIENADYERYLESEVDSLSDFLNDTEGKNNEITKDVFEVNLDQMEDTASILEAEPIEMELDNTEILQELENKLLESEEVEEDEPVEDGY